MDSLEEQLAQLKLINSRPLSPRIASGGSSSSLSAAILLVNNGSPKKVGPAVPPKPIKNRFPEVPQSILVQNACEPLYSKRLQMDNANDNSSSTSSLTTPTTATTTTITTAAATTAAATTLTELSKSKTELMNKNPNKLIFDNNSMISNKNVINNLPILHRKQPIYAQQHHIYSNIKMTLDNPAILDQQLEALEYRKKQLEKKGLMPSSISSSNQISNGPKLSSASYINGEIAAAAAVTKVSPSLSMMTMLLEQQQQQQSSLTSSPNNIYTNSMNNYHKQQLSNSSIGSSSNSSTSSVNRLKNNQQDIVYSNIMHNQQQQQQQPQPQKNQQQQQQDNHLVYNNIDYNLDDDLPPPPPIKTILTTTSSSSSSNLNDSTNCMKYLNQNSSCNNGGDNSEDDLPPPPSPVSSSYSELRRATDNYPQMPSYPQMTAYQTINNKNNSLLNDNNSQKLLKNNSSNVHDGGITSRQSINNSQTNDSTLHGSNNQTYMNTLYHHNDYSPYAGPQSFCQSSSASDYYGYGSISQGSLTYDSIYEPINPRPPSQLSSRSNYSLYTSYVNGPQSTSSGSHTPIIIDNNISSSGGGGGGNGGNLIGTNNNPNPNTNNLKNRKEAEVEALTDLLVHSMDSGNDVDSYGICVKCGERVVGENSGCTAMDQIYHIACFTCNQCQINLQGKPFYSLENHPYCEEDYLNTLEKCSVCMKPILERILRATGKPYHPQCFTCVVCFRSLDGIPFTVDATNQNYCIQDFHKKFAPRCCVCRQPIMPEMGQDETVRVVALDRSFHFECYKCEDCGLLLSSEAEGRGCYPLDDHVLCKSCNAKRVQALTNRMTTEL